jgi:uncharacterized tellurite resistance protein B-like protein
MCTEEQKEWFSDIETIVTEPLKFKAMLGIGEDAYTSHRLITATREVWEVAGVAGTAAMAANSTIVATTFFPATGWLAAIGLGAAATPIGWVIVTSVLTGGAWLGVTRYLKKTSKWRVTFLQDFINTPLDVLAVSLFDMMAPLALKVANVDGHIDEDELQTINSYFVDQWGYSKAFVDEGIAFVVTNLSDHSIKNLAQTIAEFQKQNPDCNYESMTTGIITFLNRIMEADGKIDEREEMAIEKVQSVFKEVA